MALDKIAGLAAGHRVLPGITATLGFWDHMVNGCLLLPAAGGAILADIGVP